MSTTWPSTSIATLTALSNAEALRQSDESPLKEVSWKEEASWETVLVPRGTMRLQWPPANLAGRLAAFASGSSPRRRRGVKERR